MNRLSQHFARGLMAASTALMVTVAPPALAGPGKDHHARFMAAKACVGGAARKLTVAGQGEARVAPDMATVQLGVTTQAETAAEAMRENSTLQAAVIAALKQGGLAEKDIQTSGLNLNPVMDYGDQRPPRVTGYQASNMVAIRVTDLARLAEVLDAIVGAGANEINGISFGRDDGADAEDEARRAAVADARHKAEVLAEAAGLRLGPVLVMRDNVAVQGPRPMMRMAADAVGAAESVPVQAGELAMSATVEMEYALLGGTEACGHPGGGKPAGDKRGGDGDDALPEGHPPVSPDAAPAADEAEGTTDGATGEPAAPSN